MRKAQADRLNLIDEDSPAARPRQPRLTPGTMDADQQRTYDRITAGPRGQGPQAFPLTDADGALRGPFGGFLLSPDLGDALQRVGAEVRFKTTLGDRIREMAILAVAAKWDSAFERAAHEAVGIACGVTPAEMETLAAGQIPALDDAYEASAMRVVEALIEGDVSEQVWVDCLPPLNERAVFELVALVGYYSTLALQLRVFRVEP